MLKKFVVGGAVAALLGGLVLGRETFSYLRTGAASVRQAVKAEVPVEFELARARQLVEQLVPDIRHCMHVIAEQQVDIEHLQTAIARRDGELGKQKDQILALRGDLGAGKGAYVYTGHKYTSDEVRRDLAIRFERFKAAEETLTADQKILAARQQVLAANQDKLNGMLASKKELEVKLEQLEARLHTMRAAETVAKLSIDDSNLSQVRRLLDDLNKQMDVKQRILDVEGKFTGLIPLESAAKDVPADLDSQIDAYFNQPAVAPPADAQTAAQPQPVAQTH